MAARSTPGAANGYSKQALAAAWALNQIGSQDYYNLCERFIENAYGTSGRYGSAAAAGNALDWGTDPSQADVGDLVFFKPDPSNGGYGHVGIYLGNGEMVSATNKGITRDNFLTSPYWKNLFVGFGDPPEQWQGQPATNDLIEGAAQFAGQAKAASGNPLGAAKQWAAAAWGAAAPYAGKIMDAAAKYGVPANLLGAVLVNESGGNPRARSGAGAQGLMQLMPGTARGLGVDDPYDPDQSIEGGAKYMSQLNQRFDGDWEKTVQAYNAGPNGNWNNPETRAYLDKVMTSADTIGEGLGAGGPADVAQQQQGGGGRLPPWTSEKNLEATFGNWWDQLRGMGFNVDQALQGFGQTRPGPAVGQALGGAGQAIGQASAAQDAAVRARLQQGGYLSGPSAASQIGGFFGGAGTAAQNALQAARRWGTQGAGAPPTQQAQPVQAGQTGAQGILNAMRQWGSTPAGPGGPGGPGAPPAPPGGPGAPGQQGGADVSRLEGGSTGGFGSPSGAKKPDHPQGWINPDDISDPVNKGIIGQANSILDDIQQAQDELSGLDPTKDYARVQTLNTRIQNDRQRMVQMAPQVAQVQNDEAAGREGTVAPGATPYMKKIPVYKKVNGQWTVQYLDNPSAEENPAITESNIAAGASRYGSDIARQNALTSAESAQNVAKINQQTSLGTAQISANTQRVTTALAQAVEQRRQDLDTQLRAGDLDLRTATEQFNEWYKQHVEAPLEILKAQQSTSQTITQAQQAVTQRATAQAEHERGMADIGQRAWAGAASAYNQMIPLTTGAGWGEGFQQNLTGKGYTPHAGASFNVPESLDQFATRKVAEALQGVSPYAQSVLAAQGQMGNPGVNTTLSGSQSGQPGLLGLTNEATAAMKNSLANPFPDLQNPWGNFQMPGQIDIGGMATAGMGNQSAPDMYNQMTNSMPDTTSIFNQGVPQAPMPDFTWDANNQGVPMNM